MPPRLSGVALRWFRGVKEGRVEGFEDFTVIVGRGGAGKSTVLEALYLASAWLEPLDPLRGVDKLSYIVNRQVEERGVPLNVLCYMLSTEKDPSVTLVAGAERSEFVLDSSSGDLYLKLTGELEKLLAQRLGWREADLLRFKGESLVVRTCSTSKQVQGGRNAVLEALRETIPGLLDLMSGTVLIDDYLLSNPTLVERFSWFKVLSRRLDKRVIDVIREGFEPEAEGLTYAPIGGSNTLMLQLRDTSVRIEDLGEGARRSTLAMLAILASDPKLLLLEDFEAHLHPKGLKVLTRALLQTAKEKGFQIIATTHSLEFAKVGLETAESMGLSASLIHLERSGDGMLTARKLSKPDLDLLADLGVDPRFLLLF